MHRRIWYSPPILFASGTFILFRKIVFLFLEKTIAFFPILCYTISNKIYLIKSNVVTGTMTLQQPAPR